jgi:hypothetical protein
LPITVLSGGFSQVSCGIDGDQSKRGSHSRGNSDSSGMTATFSGVCAAPPSLNNVGSDSRQHRDVCDNFGSVSEFSVCFHYRFLRSLDGDSMAVLQNRA